MNRQEKVILILGIISICLIGFVVYLGITKDNLKKSNDYNNYVSCNTGCSKMIEIEYNNSNEGIQVYNKYFFKCKDFCESAVLRGTMSK